jgi:cysteine desulfurase
MSDSIFLDNMSTTPIDPRVRDMMLQLLDVGSVGNPHSEHVIGRRMAAVIESAREQTAALIGARPEEIVFTSGATEANNLVIQGIMRSERRRGNHFVTCAIEHKCVLETAAHLARVGYRVDTLPVSHEGLIDVPAVIDVLADDTALVSIMTANNEIGTIQPITDIASACRARGIPFHTDAAQAAGKIALDVKATGVDLMSVSGHKLYAPIGIGALYISEDSPVVPEPVIFGGGQERGLRSGTLPPYLCAAFGTASAIAGEELALEGVRAGKLRDRFLEVLRFTFPEVRVNCTGARRLPGSLSLTFSGVDADRLVGAVQPIIAFSTNAACSAGILQPSHVLNALGLSEADASSTVRIAFGRFNTEPEIVRAAEQIGAAAMDIFRSESPEFAMA